MDKIDENTGTGVSSDKSDHDTGSPASNLRSHLEDLESKAIASGVLRSPVSDVQSSLRELHSKEVALDRPTSAVRSELNDLEKKAIASGSTSSSASGIKSNLQDLEKKEISNAAPNSTATVAFRSKLSDLEQKAIASGTPRIAAESNSRSNVHAMESRAMASASTDTLAIDDVRTSLQDMESKALACAPRAPLSAVPKLQSNLHDMEAKAMFSAVGPNAQSKQHSMENEVINSTTVTSPLSEANNLHSYLQSLESKALNGNEVTAESRHLFNQQGDQRKISIAPNADFKSTPGAYALPPSEIEQRLRAETEHRRQGASSEMAQMTISHTDTFLHHPLPVEEDFGRSFNSAGLLEANPVVDPTVELEVGVAMPPEEAEAFRRKMEKDTRGKQRTIWAAVAFLFVIVAAVAVVVVVVAVVATDSNSGSESKVVVTEQPAPTSMPTLAPLLHAMELPAFTLKALEDSESPQSKAYSWLKTDPMLANHSTAKLQQRMALSTFYYSTGGDNWDINTNWLSLDVDECEWYSKVGLATEESLETYQAYTATGYISSGESVCDEKGHYLEFVLPQNDLKGSIPKEFVLLSTLKRADISENALSGSVPTELGLMTHMEGLMLSGDSLVGTLPSEIGAMTSLSLLVIGKSGITGTLPSEIGNLEKMQILNFLSTRISGKIPTEILKMTDMVQIGMMAIAVVGSFLAPSACFSYMLLFCFVEFFTGTADNNSLRGLVSGTIPSEIGLFSNLEVLRFTRNSLSGSLPTELGLLTNLESLFCKCGCFFFCFVSIRDFS